jgi:hypothetical protein
MFGTATRTAVDRIKDQVALRYGAPRKLDFVMQGSIWDDPQYWMNGLAANERFYSYSWEAPDASALPNDLATVYVGAMSKDSNTSAVIIEYASPKLSQADAEDDRSMSDLLQATGGRPESLLASSPDLDRLG